MAVIVTKITPFLHFLNVMSLQHTVSVFSRFEPTFYFTLDVHILSSNTLLLWSARLHEILHEHVEQYSSHSCYLFCILMSYIYYFLLTWYYDIHDGLWLNAEHTRCQYLIPHPTKDTSCALIMHVIALWFSPFFCHLFFCPVFLVPCHSLTGPRHCTISVPCPSFATNKDPHLHIQSGCLNR